MNPDDVNPDMLSQLATKLHDVVHRISKYAETSGDRQLLILAIELNEATTELWDANTIFVYKLRIRYGKSLTDDE